MRKIIIIVAIFGIGVSAFAQVKFGIKAGVNASYLSGINFGDGHGTTGGSKFASGFHAGGYANYAINNLLGVQAEVIFSMQGGNYPDAGLGTNDELFRFNYINVPLLLEIKPFKSPLSFLAGPQFGLCVSRSFIDGLVRDDNQYNDFDFAIAWGIQYALTKHLTLGLRHNIGLIPSFDYDYEDVFDGTLQKRTVKGERNNVLQLSVGWTF